MSKGPGRLHHGADGADGVERRLGQVYRMRSSSYAMRFCHQESSLPQPQPEPESIT